MHVCGEHVSKKICCLQLRPITLSFSLPPPSLPTPLSPSQEVEEEKTLRIGAQKAEAQAVLQYQLAKAECERLKLQLEMMRQAGSGGQHWGGRGGEC